jgi:hypothetical protein
MLDATARVENPDPSDFGDVIGEVIERTDLSDLDEAALAELFGDPLPAPLPIPAPVPSTYANLEALVIGRLGRVDGALVLSHIERLRSALVTVTQERNALARRCVSTATSLRLAARQLEGGLS